MKMSSHYKNEGKLIANDCGIEWRIYDIFGFPLDKNIEIQSQKFCIAGRTWILKVFPNGRILEKTEGWLGIALCARAVRPQNFLNLKSLSVRFSIVGKTGTVVSSIPKISGTWYRADKLIKTEDFISRRNEASPDNDLTILCEIQNLLESENEEHPEEEQENAPKTEEKLYHLTKENVEHPEDEEENAPKTEEKLSHLPKGISKALQDYKELLLSEKHSDITIKVRNKQFKAHREILAARNPVFAAMLEHNMKEKATGIVTIEDMDPRAFPDFLEYLYTGHVQNLSSENVLELFTASDKYQVQELKEECIVHMKGNLSVENFCGIMSVSLRHRENELIALATQFFIENAVDIVKSCDWQVFMSQNLVAANELFIKQLEFNNRKKATQLSENN